MAQAAELLVGRADELAVLEQALVATDSGGPIVIELFGEPGIGKTRLLTELGRLGEEQKRLVLSGRASELENDLPYWIFVDALDEYVRTLDSEWVGEIDRRSGGELARIFPSVAENSVAPATVLDERYRVHRAVRELLEQLAEQTPLVLLLDDLHWADPASADLVGALLRRPPQASVLVALAFRRAQISPRLDTALEGCHRARELVRIELSRLDEAEVEQLLGPDFPPSLGKRLFEESGGNPFYLEQLARATGAEPQIARPQSEDAVDGEGSGVPRAVALALTDELATLSTRARSLLEAGAVVGDPFELEFAAAAEAVSESEALFGLDELLMFGLVRRTDAPRRFRFRHPLLRRAVYDATSAEWKSTAHERVARALAANSRPAIVRARHVEQFALLGDREAIAVLREAADASAVRAPASAARWYRAALRLLPADPTDERAKVLVRLADVLAGTGEFAESRDTLVELLDRIPAEDRTMRIKLVGDCARVEHLLGSHDDAHRRLLDALEELPDHATEEETTLLLGLAMDAYYRRDYQGMRDWSARALGSAEQLSNRLLEASARGLSCLAYAYGGQTADADRERIEAAAIVDALGDAELARRLDAAAIRPHSRPREVDLLAVVARGGAGRAVEGPTARPTGRRAAAGGGARVGDRGGTRPAVPVAPCQGPRRGGAAHRDAAAPGAPARIWAQRRHRPPSPGPGRPRRR